MSVPESNESSGSLLTGATGDRCATCDARLAIDQRYCVECGTRRGNPRFTLARPEAEPAAGVAAAGQLGAAAFTRMQMLLALLIVLVALGVGVLIGSGTSSAPQVTVKASGVTTTAKSGSGGGATKPSTNSGSGNLFKSGS